MGKKAKPVAKDAVTASMRRKELNKIQGRSRLKSFTTETPCRTCRISLTALSKDWIALQDKKLTIQNEFAAHSYAALGLDRPISTKKVNDLRVQYSKWVPRTRWPDFLE
eukprot:TRINITY_DN6476_c0_g1_i5.p1 TRINITY_DN6476_c0_g1~~TRINITY_DN6476_c0_g1_i5.p1  ORF type:complete len:109 (+),score=20.31 TRINITY_DN6476_c0_g1_i5:235-561(+)